MTDNTSVDFNSQTVEIPNSGGARQCTIQPVGVLLENVFEDVKTVAESLHRGYRMSNNGPCLGWRDSKPEYKWLSYKEVIERSKNISYGLVRIGMKKGQESFVAIYAQNCVEWVLVEHACYGQSAVVVPLYDTLGPTACSFILNHVEAEFLFCDTEEKVNYILKIKEDIPNLSYIVVAREVSDKVKNLAVQKGVKLHSLKEVEELGRKKPDSFILPSPSDLATICYTSGTTGDPKGVMLTHGNIIANMSGIIKHAGVDLFGPEDRLISYLPMAHMLDRVCQIIFYSTGGCVGFSRGDIKLLAEDLAVLKPTMMHSVPRVLNRVYDKVQDSVRSNPLKKFLLDKALRRKQAEIERGIIRKDSLWDIFILRNVRNAFGGKLRILMTGGAPIRDDVLSFLKCSIGCPVAAAYGQTECTCGSNSTLLYDYKVGNVGPPIPCNAIKLADVPDMGYFSYNGEGEILIKGPNVMKGYFKDPVKTAETIDSDGWLHTGDIGKWTEYGALSVIDRKKNFFKLSQGEYISPEKIESVYQGCPCVDQIYIYGDSLESCIVGIVALEQGAVMDWADSQKIIWKEWNDLCNNKELKSYILKELTALGTKAGLKKFEQVKAIHLYPDGFSQENGLLTATMKLKRMDCRKHFSDIIRNMYNDLQ